MLLLILSFTACSLFSTTTGDWEGECAGDGLEFDFELELTEEWGEIEGEASLSDGGLRLVGDLEGERDGNEVELDATFKQDGYVFEASFEGEIEGDELSGEFDADGQVLDCELKR